MSAKTRTASAARGAAATPVADAGPPTFDPRAAAVVASAARVAEYTPDRVVVQTRADREALPVPAAG
jgi:hypothetical protein